MRKRKRMLMLMLSILAWRFMLALILMLIPMLMRLLMWSAGSGLPRRPRGRKRRPVGISRGVNMDIVNMKRVKLNNSEVKKDANPVIT